MSLFLFNRAVLPSVAGKEHAGADAFRHCKDVAHGFRPHQPGFIDPNQLAGRLLLKSLVEQEAGHGMASLNPASRSTPRLALADGATAVTLVPPA